MTISFNRKAFWRRVCIFALVVGFSVTAAVLMFWGASARAVAERQLGDLARGGSMLRIRINQMQAECRVAKFKEADPDLFRARMADLMEETLESAQQVATVWWKLGLADEVAGVRKDLEELGKATGRVLDAPDVHRQGVSEVLEDLESLERVRKGS